MLSNIAPVGNGKNHEDFTEKPIIFNLKNNKGH
jgi:hypothetical protein